MLEPAVYVGNDVVDLEDPRTFGKSDDERFVARVFDTQGLAAIRDAEDPDLELWCRWAAKEAAYKVASKLARSPPPFVHRAFQVAWNPSGRSAARGVEAAPARRMRADVRTGAPGEADTPRARASSGDLGLIREGAVTYEARVIPVRVATHVEAGRRCAVHALAHAGPSGAPDRAAADRAGIESWLDLLDSPAAPWTGTLEDLVARFTERELDAVRSLRSAAVRLAARASLADRIGVAEQRLEIVCDAGPLGRRPPRVLVDGAPAAADVSLSHDGRWIAWSTWIP